MSLLSSLVPMDLKHLLFQYVVPLLLGWSIRWGYRKMAGIVNFHEADNLEFLSVYAIEILSYAITSLIAL
ncbi:hypothetical protein P171DRAFT_521293 [Karstenula rhodostoma CBS 690.94]|uniref:Uncharacterized protein n=1 Tax=Karstenula rhodostoma CBS 690.94 TaxID=1392251 RepID=A0A9P4PJS7_9PLEO|nr:hypothetical protein P171DRAFT_521293 [Karstenula rhodostoma CBS 690.94]